MFCFWLALQIATFGNTRGFRMHSAVLQLCPSFQLFHVVMERQPRIASKFTTI
ncbi:hypothetical protein DEO72_LG2g2679 [Vigna unguiculata]|uniref:Uncharacterized protein n=1 Tax=Vigna unguiculata TaxID=3917 RepID=A0A4D6L1G7_VIGUN|nr:hypothetical protein DEO72_LG2g2679 [Vigna unguiculata]